MGRMGCDKAGQRGLGDQSTTATCILSSMGKMETCLSVVRQVSQVCLFKYNKTPSTWPHLSYPRVPDVLGVEELGAVEHRDFCS